MKNKCMKILACLVLCILTLNFIGPTVLAVDVSRAIENMGIVETIKVAETTPSPAATPNSTTTPKAKDPAANIGDASAKQKEQTIIDEATKALSENTLGTIADGIVGVMTSWMRLLAVALGTAGRVLATVTAHSAGVSNGEASFVTPDQILFNRLAITDINFFQEGSFGSGKSSTPLQGTNNPVKIIRDSIAKWYYTLRTIAIIILLCVLIYVGVRMAITSVAEEKAVYKQWLWNWLVSMCLLFVLHYIIVAVINVNNSFVDILYQAKVRAFQENPSIFNDYVTGLAFKGVFYVQSGLAAWSYVVTYLAIVAFTLIFLIMYIKRMITVAFLMLISPIITITYSIDKLADGKSQALNTWLREFLEAVLIQPFHCIIYLVFISTAIKTISTFGTLAAGVFTVMCLFFVLEAEKIIKEIFGFEKDVSGNFRGSALAVAGAVGAVQRFLPKNKGKAEAATANANTNTNTNTNGKTSQNAKTAVNSTKPSNVAQQNLRNAGNVTMDNTVSSTTNERTVGNSGIILAGNAENYNSATQSFNEQMNAKNTGGSTIINPSPSRTVGDSGIILAGNAENYNSATQSFNQQLNSGSLGQGGTINQNDRRGSQGTVILGQGGTINQNDRRGSQGSVILGPNGAPLVNSEGKPMITGANAASIIGGSRSEQLASNEIEKADNEKIEMPEVENNNPKSIKDRIFDGAKYYKDKAITGVKSMDANTAWKLAKKTQVGGLGAAMGVVAATMSGVGGGNIGTVAGAATGAYVAGNAVEQKGKEKLDNYMKERRIRNGEKNLATAYENYKNSGNYSDEQMQEQTTKMRQMSNKDIGKMKDGDAKTYARALKAMPIIYSENGRDNDPNQELADTLRKIQEGKITPKN